MNKQYTLSKSLSVVVPMADTFAFVAVGFNEHGSDELIHCIYYKWQFLLTESVVAVSSTAPPAIDYEASGIVVKLRGFYHFCVKYYKVID